LEVLIREVVVSLLLDEVLDSDDADLELFDSGLEPLFGLVVPLPDYIWDLFLKSVDVVFWS
jgi:hypothetical protein